MVRQCMRGVEKEKHKNGRQVRTGACRLGKYVRNGSACARRAVCCMVAQCAYACARQRVYSHHPCVATDMAGGVGREVGRPENG